MQSKLVFIHWLDEKINIMFSTDLVKTGRISIFFHYCKDCRRTV